MELISLYFLLIFIICLCCWKKNDKKEIPCYIIISIVVLLFSLTSVMSPFGNHQSFTDSSVFRYIGTMMQRGKIPYVDIFDHKGILLYVINWLGALIHPTSGIWFIEIIFLFFTFFFCYKLSRLFSEKIPSLLIVFILLFSLLYVYEGGNLVEEYALFFITYSLYVFIKDWYLNEEVRYSTIVLIGLLFGCTILIRPNMIALWICIVVSLVFLSFKNKSIRQLFSYAFSFLLGCIIIVLPFLCYLISVHALSDFIEQYLIFNFRYSAQNGNESLLYLVKSFMSICKLILPIFIINVLLLLKNEKLNKIIVFNLFFLIISFILVITPKSLYYHYAMVMLPCFIIPLALFLNFIINKCFSFIKNSWIEIGILSIIVVLFSCKDFVFWKEQVMVATNKENPFAKIEEIIINNSEEDDEILVYGNKALLYLNTNRYTSIKYIYQYPILQVDDQLRLDFERKVKNYRPKFLLFEFLKKAEVCEILPFVKQDYIEIQFESGYVLYQRK